MENIILWSESEVRRRLQEFLKDDSLYDCYAPQLSAIKYGYSSNDDGIPKKMYRLLKRDDLSKAMVDALLPPDGRNARTKKQVEYVDLYNLIRLVYVFDLGIGQTAKMLGRPRSKVKYQVDKAVSIVTGYLNSSETKKSAKCAAEELEAEQQGFVPVPKHLETAAKKKLNGSDQAMVSLTSGGKLSKFAAQKRKEKRQMAKKSRRKNRR